MVISNMEVPYSLVYGDAARTELKHTVLVEYAYGEWIFVRLFNLTRRRTWSRTQLAPRRPPLYAPIIHKHQRKLRCVCV